MEGKDYFVHESSYVDEPSENWKRHKDLAFFSCNA